MKTKSPIWLIRTLEALIILLLVGVSAPLVYVFNQRLDRKMLALKAGAVQMMEERLGRKISYRSISPSIFGFLAVRDLRVHRYREPEAVLLKINRVKIYYSIFKLVWTGDPGQSFREINIANSLFQVDREQDREVFEFLDQLRIGRNRGTGPAGGIPPALKLSGANITVRYTAQGRHFELSKLFFTLASRQDLYHLSVRGTVRYTSDNPSAMIPLIARIRMEGQVEHQLAWSDLRVRLYSLQSHRLTLGRQTFQVTLKNQELSVRKIQDRAPLDLHALLDLPSGDLTVTFKTEGFVPSSALRLKDPIYRPWLDSSLTASGRFTYNLNDDTFNYLLDLRARVMEDRLFGEMEIVSHAFGDERILYLEPLTVRSAKGSLKFSGSILLGSYLPAGLLQLGEVAVLPGQKLNAVFRLVRTGRSFSVQGKHLLVGATGFSLFTLEIAPQYRSMAFSLNASLAGTPDNSVKASGLFFYQPKALLNLSAQLVNIPMSTLYQTLAPARLYTVVAARQMDPLNLSLHLQTETDFSRYSLTAPEVRLTHRLNRENQASLSLVARNDDIQINDLKALWNGYRLSGQFHSAANRQGSDFEASLEFQGLPYQFTGSYVPRKRVHIDGSYGFHASWTASAQAASTLYSQNLLHQPGSPLRINLEAFPIPFKRGTLKISTAIQGVRTPRGGLYLISEKTVLKDIPFIQIKENELSLAFTFQKDLLDLEQIVYRDSLSELAGGGEFFFRARAAETARGYLSLGSETRQEWYSLAANLAGGELEAELSFQRAPLSRLGDLIISGEGTGRVAVSGAISDPEVEVDFTLYEGRLNVEPLSLDFSARYNRRQLDLSSLNLAYLNHRITDGRGWLNAPSGTFEFLSAYKGEQFRKPVEMTVALQGNLHALDNPLAIGSPYTSELQGQCRLSDIRVLGDPYPDWAFSLQATGEQIKIDGGPSDSIHLQLAESGTFTLNLLAPLPVQGVASGQVAEERLESVFIITGMDMRAVNVLFGTDFLNFTGGSARGNLRITGLISDPDFYGLVEVEGSRMTFRLSPDEVAPLNTRLIFNEKIFLMEPVTGRSDKAQVTAEGIFYLDHWSPVAYELDFRVDNKPGMWIRHTFGFVSTDGYAVGRVRVEGDPNTIQVSGDLFLSSCRIALEKQEPRDPDRTPLGVELSFVTGSKVEFFWPSTGFPIIRTYAKQGERVSLSVDGESGDFKMTGTVEIRGGEIFYFDRNFYLKEGSITFGEELEIFDPRIKALAELRERGQDNQEITIFLEADDRLSQFSPHFYSEPSLPDTTIVEFLGGSVLDPREEANPEVSTALLAAGDVAGQLASQFILLSPFEREVREMLGLDLFSIRTQFVQNVLFTRLLGENSPAIGINPLDNTTLSLGKYLGTDVFLEMLVRFRSVDVTSPGYAGTGQIRTEGEINLEWTTPFFLLEWSFNPQHPEDLFLTDNTIGLRWRFSY